MMTNTNYYEVETFNVDHSTFGMNIYKGDFDGWILWVTLQIALFQIGNLTNSVNAMQKIEIEANSSNNRKE